MTMVRGEQFECMSYEVPRTLLNQTFVKELIQRLVDEGKISDEEARSCYVSSSALTIKTARIDVALKPKWVAPSLGANATPEFIVDQLGTVRERMANDKKTEGFLKEALKSKANMDGTDAPPTNAAIEEDGEDGGFSTDNPG